MHYSHVTEGIFLSRPNRFIAHVEINGKEDICHVKITGRCRELLIPGCHVWCACSDNLMRKTAYDLIAVQKGQKLINMDSQAPNAAAKQWLQSGGLGHIENLRAETVHEDSRFDFSFLKDGKLCFLEVKGVTLEKNGICAFPAAPTVRGVKHLQGLTRAVQAGYGGYVLFVIQMEQAYCLLPNDTTDPAFGNALRAAAKMGVQLIAVSCKVTPDSMNISACIPVNLP